MLKSVLFVSFLIAILSSALAEEDRKVELACTHVQVCNLVEELLSESKETQQVKVTMPFQIQGDPHHFEPGPNVVKTLLRTPYLLAPSRHLSPWLGKIIQQRSQNKRLKSLELPLHNPSQAQKKFGREVLAHFWLHPESLCQAKKNVAQQLLKWDLISQSNEVQCSSSGIKMLGKKLKQSSQKVPLVLYHDALMPYFSQLGIQAFALKGSGHGEQVSVQKLKKFHQYLAKNPRVLWVRENSIQIHSQLKGLQRKKDLSLQIDTLGQRHQLGTHTLTSVLKELILATTQHPKELQ